MGQPEELKHIEFDQEQIAAVLSFAAQHHISPADVVRHALNLYVVSERGEAWVKARASTLPPSSDAHDAGPDPVLLQPSVRESGDELARRRRQEARALLRKEGIGPVTFVLDGEEFTDGMAYQERIRSEW